MPAGHTDIVLLRFLFLIIKFAKLDSFSLADIPNRLYNGNHEPAFCTVPPTANRQPT